MKVKIAYTVEHDEIPAEIAKFLEKAQESFYKNGESLSELSNKLKHAFDVNNLEAYADQLHNVRVSFVGIDTVLADCADVFAGFKQLLDDQAEKVAQEIVQSDLKNQEVLEEGEHIDDEE